MPSWENLLQAQHRCLNATGFKIDYCSTRERTAVIVEPRPHLYLRPVVENMMRALNGSGSGKSASANTWNLMIFTATTNELWLRETMAPHEYGVKYFNLDNLTISQYSRLLMTPAFWETIPTEHILIFQTDTLALRPWNPAFEAYDYIGANYYERTDVLEDVGGIQGGLSYRKRSAMLACLSAITQADVVAYRSLRGLPPLKSVKDDTIAEDVYFTHAVGMLKRAYAPISIRAFFSVETDLYDAPFGLHGWNCPYFTESQRTALIWGSPLMRPLIFLCDEDKSL